MRFQSIKLYDINGYLVKHITPRQAHEMIDEGEVQTIRARGAKPGTFVAVQLKQAKRNRETAATLTLRDVVNNAFGKAFSALGPTDSIRALDRAIEKVEAWPDAHDTKAVCISAGRVIQPATV